MSEELCMPCIRGSCIEHERKAHESHWAKVYAGQIAAHGFVEWSGKEKLEDIVGDIRQYARALAKEMCREDKENE